MILIHRVRLGGFEKVLDKSEMRNTKQMLISAVQKAVRDITGSEVVVVLSRPQHKEHGDYATNVALIASKQKNPLELAQEIARRLENLNLDIIKQIDVVPPGFINIWLSDEVLLSELTPVLQKKSSQKVMIEFTDPNPFKEFHIGHLYSNAVGESLARLQEALGATVARANYQGDVGMHVAKALYGTELKIKSEKLKVDDLQKRPLRERVKVLGEAYVQGAAAFEESEAAKQEITDINRRVFAKDPSIMPLYETGRQWSLEAFEVIYKRLGTKFDFYYFESEVGEPGKKLVLEFLKKGVFEESDGAIIFRGEKMGLHNRVFINSLGLPTYEAKEMGLAPTKYKDFPYDVSIIVTGNEVSAYFKVVLAALSKVSPDLAKKTTHIGHGMVRLPEGKMSSRTGNIKTGEWLLDETKKRLLEAYPSMQESIAEKVAVGAVKYALLRVGVGRDIVFNFDSSLSFEGESGPYLQYTYARTQSVLKKIKSEKLKVKSEKELTGEEQLALRLLYRFPEIAEEAAENYAPSTLCTYLFDLAQAFNLFYQKDPILSAEEKTRELRIVLTKRVGEVLKTGLHLLGIAAPQKM